MKTCQCCGAVATSDVTSCAICGEGSWADAPALAPKAARPKAQKPVEAVADPALAPKVG